MALTLYRRHRIECEGGHVEDSRSGEFEEGRRGWRKCACLIHASGTLGPNFRRKQTGKATWDEARQVAASWEAAQAWDVPARPVTDSLAQVVDSGRTTIKTAIEAFLGEFGGNRTTGTEKKYRLLLTKLKAFAESKGYLVLDQLTPVDVREFRSSWAVSPQTSAKYMSTIKGFFEFCLSNEWITRNPARLVKNQRGREAADRRGEQKLPFTDDELRAMYEACDTKYGRHEVKWSRESDHDKPVSVEYTRYNFKWTGQDLADFISISVYTGLRISDVSTFRIDRMRPTGEIQVRTTKAGTNVYTWVPEWLQERIRARARERGPLIFGEHQTKNIEVITDLWRRKLIKLWSLCGLWNDKSTTQRPTPHRFRHTFARILLQRPGVSVRDVAELLGNSEAIVRKHYAAWIPERQERLTAILRDAFSEKPRPNTIELPGTGVR